MKTISVPISDNIEEAAQDFIKAGFFKSETDLFVIAISDFLRRNQISLIEKFAKDDIEWAKLEAKKKK